MNIWIILVGSLVLSALFSGLEIAFITTKRLPLEMAKKRGVLSARIISKFNQNPSHFIGSLLLGNNIVLVIFSLTIAQLLEPFLLDILPPVLNNNTAILLIQTFISTLIILIFAEYLAKIVFKLFADTLIRFFAIPASLFFYLLYPFIFLYLSISEILIYAFFRIKITKKEAKFDYVDLDIFLSEYSSKNITEQSYYQEIKMVRNFIDFKKVKLRECMIPRTEITAINVDDTVEELKKLFVEHRHSRILVYSQTLDNIIGYCHSYDLLKKPTHIKDIVREIFFLPETTLANDSLSLFISKKQNLAVVVDEFGGVAGIVTTEDIIEEIFGEIEDEFDEEENVEKKISKTEYIFSARLEIDYLNEKYHFTLPESNHYNTLSGLLINYSDGIPKIGDKYTIGNYTFMVLNGTKNKIDIIKIIVNPEVS